MKTLWWVVFRRFIPVFLPALLFFVLILELADLFPNLWNYLNENDTYSQIALVQFYYLPKCLSYSLPIAVLFAVSFTLGSMYENNELIAVFGSGVSLAAIAVPLFAFGVFASIFGYTFHENVGMESSHRKNQLTDVLLHRRSTLSNSNVTVLGSDGRIIYHADFYNDGTQTLSGLIVLERDDAGNFVERIDAQTATWAAGAWDLHRARVVTWNADRSFLVQTDRESFRDTRLIESPGTFRRTVRNVDEMQAAEARKWIDSLRRAGLPYRNDLTDYYNRFTFALTPFIVTIIACAFGGRLKKNILLMSLLSSLILAVIYYVTQMLAVLLAKLGYISPLTGAASGVLVFAVAGIWLFRQART